MPLDLAFDLAHTLDPRVCDRYGRNAGNRHGFRLPRTLFPAATPRCLSPLRPPNAFSKGWIVDGVFGTTIRRIQLTEGV
jgi:hypothetical protein